MLLLLLLCVCVQRLGWRKRNRPTPYVKDDLLGEPEDSLHMASTGTREQPAFDNPIYDSEMKKAQGADGETDVSEETKMREQEAITMLKFVL